MSFQRVTWCTTTRNGTGSVSDWARLEGFAGAVTAAPRRREPSPGLGEDARLCAKGLVGSGLEVDGELLQLSAFTTA